MLGKAVNRERARDASAPLLVLCKARWRSVDGLACEIEDATNKGDLIVHFLLNANDLLCLRRLLRLRFLRRSPHLLLLVRGRLLLPRPLCMPLIALHGRGTQFGRGEVLGVDINGIWRWRG